MDGIKRYFVIHSKDTNRKLMLWLFEISMFISTFAFNTKWSKIKIKKKNDHFEMKSQGTVEKKEREKERKNTVWIKPIHHKKSEA